jgi:hypothetical protein
MTDLLHKDVIPSNPIDAAMIEVEALALAPDASHDHIAERYPVLRDKLEFMQRRIAEVMDALDERAVEWIKLNKRDIEYAVDDKGNKMRLYLAHPKTTKCVDVPRTLTALIEHSLGDWQMVESCLSANAIKPGAAKKVLSAEAFAECFTVETRDKLESGEVAPKELQRFDERFSK